MATPSRPFQAEQATDDPKAPDSIKRLATQIVRGDGERKHKQSALDLGPSIEGLPMADVG
jgi:hypothetical protein